MTMTADDLVTKARTLNPKGRYTRNVRGDAVGSWNANRGRWQTIAGLGIDGSWYSMTHEVLVDGEPLNKPSDWMPEGV